jgi:putative endonuclease
MHYVYIIFSKKLDKFYIGESKNPEERTIQHNESFFSNSWTSKTNDWELQTVIQFDNIANARKAELFIKKMKSIDFIKKLILNSDWLREKFNAS